MLGPITKMRIRREVREERKRGIYTITSPTFFEDTFKKYQSPKPTKVDEPQVPEEKLLSPEEFEQELRSKYQEMYHKYDTSKYTNEEEALAERALKDIMNKAVKGAEFSWNSVFALMKTSTIIELGSYSYGTLLQYLMDTVPYEIYVIFKGCSGYEYITDMCKATIRKDIQKFKANPIATCTDKNEKYQRCMSAVNMRIIAVAREMNFIKLSIKLQRITELSGTLSPNETT